MVIASRAAPIDILRGLTRYEAPVLPEIFTGTSAPSAMQSVNDGRCNTARFKNESRHGIGQFARTNRRLLYSARFDIARL
jgi:hypothetical protein